MTKYAEIVFEPGAHSVISYEDENELRAFIAEHHRRAVNGEPGAPQEQYGRNDLDASDFAVMPTVDRMKERPAERISKVYLFDQHPADMYDSRVDAKVAQDLISGMADKNGTIDHEQLVRAMRDEASPVHVLERGRRDSFYKADSSGELDLGFLNEGSAA